MSARENILVRIRARQSTRSGGEPAAREVVRAHLAAHPQNPRPAVTWDPVARFRAEALKLASTVAEVESMAAGPACIGIYLDSQRLPREAVCWDALGSLDWRAAGIEVAMRLARASDLIGITGSFCAIAETGTLMMLSGAQMPCATSLLPETHIAIVEKSRIVPGMEEAWQLMRTEQRQAPRAVHFISGPSRTADIEQTVTLGAHGPYRVHIVLVGKGA